MFNSGIVTNGGFKTGDFTGWSFPSGESYASVSSGSTYVHSGTYGAQLGPTSLQSLTQTLSTTTGKTYTLSFWLRNYSGANNQFLVSWNGNTLLNLTNLPAGAWSNYVFSVTASSISTVLEFGYDNGPSYFGLDDISVVPVPLLNVEGVKLSGMNIVLEGINGVLGGTNYVLTSTNLTLPLSRWTTVATNVLGAPPGVFPITITNTMTPGVRQRYYILKSE